MCDKAKFDLSDLSDGPFNDVNTDEFISVKLQELNRLHMRDARLSKLEAAGVDNWEGYDEATKIVIDDDELTMEDPELAF